MIALWVTLEGQVNNIADGIYTERGETKVVLRVWAAGRMRMLLRREREMEEMVNHEKSLL